MYSCFLSTCDRLSQVSHPCLPLLRLLYISLLPFALPAPQPSLFFSLKTLTILNSTPFHSMQQDKWPELLPTLLGNVTGEFEERVKVATLQALGYMCDDVSPCPPLQVYPYCGVF